MQWHWAVGRSNSLLRLLLLVFQDYYSAFGNLCEEGERMATFRYCFGSFWKNGDKYNIIGLFPHLIPRLDG